MNRATSGQATESRTAQWFAILAPPLAWAAQQQLSYQWVPSACSTGATGWLHVIHAVALVVALAAGAVAWRERSRQPAPEPPAPARHRFTTLFGLFTSGLFSLVIVAQWLPLGFFGPC